MYATSGANSEPYAAVAIMQPEGKGRGSNDCVPVVVSVIVIGEATVVTPVAVLVVLIVVVHILVSVLVTVEPPVVPTLVITLVSTLVTRLVIVVVPDSVM